MIDIENPENINFDAELCEFGKWFNNFSKENLSNVILIDQIKQSHENIHKFAKNIRENKEANNKELIKKQYELLKSEHEKLINYINNLEQDFS